MKFKTVISKTPLRISFVGGGTDFPDFYKKIIVEKCLVPQ